jgi:hypothetical protein
MRSPWIIMAALLPGIFACDGNAFDPPTERVVAEIRVTPASVQVRAGSSLQLTAVALDAGGSPVMDAGFTWSSAAPEIATVSAGGLVTGVRPGSVVLTVSCRGATRQLTVEVIASGSVEGASADWHVDVGFGHFVRVNAVHGAALDAVFVVGSTTGDGCCAAVYRYDGSSWSLMRVPAWAEIRAVWAASATEIFVGGADYIGHLDGSTWTTLQRDHAIQAIWGFSPSDVFAGGPGVLLHFDGAAWRSMDVPAQAGAPAPSILGMWGSSPVDVFAVGAGGVILHYDGSGWARQESPTALHLSAVWGTSGTDVFAVGDQGVVLHYDGIAWSVMVAPGGPQALKLYGVWGLSGTDVFAVGGEDGFGCCHTLFHYTGTAWAEWSGPIVEAGPGRMWYGESLRGIWGTDGHLFAVGTGPTILHRPSL